jgi:hypothetical protein
MKSVQQRRFTRLDPFSVLARREKLLESEDRLDDGVGSVDAGEPRAERGRDVLRREGAALLEVDRVLVELLGDRLQRRPEQLLHARAVLGIGVDAVHVRQDPLRLRLLLGTLLRVEVGVRWQERELPCRHLQ